MSHKLLAASSQQRHRHDRGLGRTSFVLGEPPHAQHWELDFAYFAAFAADRQPVVRGRLLCEGSRREQNTRDLLGDEIDRVWEHQRH